MNAVYELAASERLFYMNLDKIEQLFVQPLLQLGQTFSCSVSSYLPLMHTRTHTCTRTHTRARTHTHTRLMALFPGLPRWAGTRKVKPIWILLKQETMSGSDISWAICKSAPHSRQITTPAPHHSVFYRPDVLPAAQPTASKHWRHSYLPVVQFLIIVVVILTLQL